jgi:hypothetical protein
MAKINITLFEGARWLAGKLQEMALGVVPDPAKLQILTERMQADRDQKRRDYHAALTAELAIFDPDPEKMGSLERLEAQLAKRNRQGEAWGAELTGDQKPSEARRTELEGLLKACSSEVEQLERNITTEKSLLTTRRQTTQLRKRLFEEAAAEVAKLEKIAPAILAQTQALKQAQKERLAAVEAQTASKGHKGQAGAILAQFQQELEQAQAGDSAAQTIEIEETDQAPDLDAIAAKEDALAASDERIARWTRKAPAPVGA